MRIERLTRRRIRVWLLRRCSVLLFIQALHLNLPVSWRVASEIIAHPSLLFLSNPLWRHTLAAPVGLARGMRLYQRNAMLRIMLHQDDTKCRLELAGKLCGPWVGETERVWRSAPWSGKEIEVDIREVTGVDGAGRKLLTAMHHAGAHLIAKGVWMTTLIEEITGDQHFEGAKRQRRRNNPPQDKDSRIRRDSK